MKDNNRVEAKVRCSIKGTVNIPDNILNQLGWKINEEVVITCHDTILDDKREISGITIETVANDKLLDAIDDIDNMDWRDINEEDCCESK